MRLRLLACALASAFLFTVNALADTYTDIFTLSNGTDTITWSLPSDLTVTNYNASLGFFVNGVTFQENGTSFTGSLKFLGNYLGVPGVTVCSPDCTSAGSVLMSGKGALLFTGTTSPIFTLGTYNLSTLYDSVASGPYTLTITDPPVGPSGSEPVREPSSMLLLLSGGLALAGLRRWL